MTIALLVLLAISLALQIYCIFRVTSRETEQLAPRFDMLERNAERLERSLREEISKNRDENARLAREDREELAEALTRFNDLIVKSVQQLAEGQRERLEKLTETNERKLESLRAVVDERLRLLQEDNTTKLEQMRNTVDEKLQSTLETRLDSSFKQVSERLEQVHRGLGEMQGLAAGVGDLKRVLTNVKSRGAWGEVQLEALLSEILIPSQYAKNVKTNSRSDDLVEFAIKLPGQGNGNPEVFLPVDSKYPIEDYQRLLDALENADTKAIEEARRSLDRSIKVFAKDISTKYLNPPSTTDFGIMFLPTEGLYAEVVRRPGLMENLQREFRVVLSGPATFGAFLNSLQMGFKTLAIEKRSSEVWSLLGAVKTDFARFTVALEGVKNKIEKASSAMETAAVRSRQIERRLKNVEGLPETETQALLPELTIEEDVANT